MGGEPGGSAAVDRPGFAVRVRRVAGAPVAAVRVWIVGGARLEETPGLALVAGRTLTEGTRRRDWRRISDQAEDRGMIVSSFGTFEVEGVTVDALADDWELALAWAAELTLEPVFPAERTAWTARQATAELESLADQPDVRTAWGFLEELYAPHPRSRPVQGTAASLATIGPAACAAFHRASLARGVLVSVAGAVPEEAVATRAGELFAAVPRERWTGPGPPAPVGLPEMRREVKLPGADQAHLYVGHLTVPRRHPDFEALELLGVILGAGAGLTGRIPERIREREGLAYTARAQTVVGAGIDPGRLMAYVGTSASHLERAERGVREEIARLVEGGVTDAELEESRAYLLGREPFHRETARQWADLLGESMLYDLPLHREGLREQRLRAVDRAALEAAARRHLRPGELRVAVGIPA